MTATASTKGSAPKAPKKGQTVVSMMAEPWKPSKEGDCLEGRYLGVETVKGKGNRRDFKSYHVEQPDGKRVRVASAMLGTKMNQVPKGTYVWLTYSGMFQTSNGESADYEVAIEEGVDLLDPLQSQEAVAD